MVAAVIRPYLSSCLLTRFLPQPVKSLQQPFRITTVVPSLADAHSAKDWCKNLSNFLTEVCYVSLLPAITALQDAVCRNRTSKVAIQTTKWICSNALKTENIFRK